MNLDHFKTLGRQVQEATQAFHENLTAMREAIAEKDRQIQHAKGDSGPPAEVIAERDRYVDEVARARGAQQHAAAELVRVFGAPPGHSAALNRRGPDTPWTWADQCYYNGDAIKRKDAEAIAAYAYTPGPPAAERAAVVARLEAERAQLVAQEEQLIDEAATVGLTVEHREEVKQRREGERSQRERAERAADAERRATAAAAGADDWPQPRASRSTYIHGTRG